MTGQIFFYSPYINIIIVVVMKKGVMDACIWISISISSRLLESETFHHYYLNFLHISTDIFVCLIKNRMMCKFFWEIEGYLGLFLSLLTLVWCDIGNILEFLLIVHHEIWLISILQLITFICLFRWKRFFICEQQKSDDFDSNGRVCSQSNQNAPESIHPALYGRLQNINQF